MNISTLLIKNDNQIKIIGILFILFFSFSLIIKGLSSLIFFIFALLSLIFLKLDFKNFRITRYELIFIFILLLNFFVIIFNQVSNFYFNINEYDYGIRYILSIFCFLLLMHLKPNLNNEIFIGSSLSIIFIFLSFYFIYRNEVFNLRTHTSFVDPNTIAIYLSILILIIFPLNFQKNLIFKSLILIIFFIGLYLIIQSRSRGAWLGLGCSLIYILAYSIKEKNYKIIGLVTFIFSSIFLYYFFNESFNSRFNTIVLELNQRLYGNPNSSTGDRITLSFLGIDLLKNHFLFGINPNNVTETIELMNLRDKYQPHIFDIYYCCGFHNQFITILVKYGFLGLISFLLNFLYLIFLNIMYKNNFSVKIIATVICFLISSYSLETISLKYSQSIFLILLVYGYAITFLSMASKINTK